MLWKYIYTSLQTTILEDNVLALDNTYVYVRVIQPFFSLMSR